MSKDLNTWREVVEAMLNGEVVEFYNPATKQWVDYAYFPNITSSELPNPPDNCYRTKPRVILIGNVEVPEPVRDASEFEEDEVYYISLIGNKDFYPHYLWNGDDFDLRMLSRGLVHKTSDAAHLHTKALIEISGGSYES